MKVLWRIAGFTAMVAALATWLIGFMHPQESFVTTTVALVMGVGGFWMVDMRRRRWGVLLVFVSLGFSAFLANGGASYAIWRFPFGITSLLFALMGAVTRDRPRRDPDEAAEPGGDSARQ